MIDLQRYIPMAQMAQEVICQVLNSRPGISADYVQNWVLRGTPQNDVIFYAVLDAERIPRPEPFAQATHQISSALKGARVYWGNHTGFRYAVLLSPAKRLPKRIDLPETFPAGRALIGQRVDGQVAGGKWGDLKHIIVVGYTGSGKSGTARALVYQAIKQGFHLILADLDGTTFPMLSNHAALLAPLANTLPEYTQAVGTALGELEHRAALYKRAANFPETIEEYNAWARQNGQPPLKRLLVALDEFNSAVTKDGGPNGRIGKMAEELGSRGRKFGITLLLSAQDFSKEVIGRVRDEVGVIIAHRLNSVHVARNVGLEAAFQIPDSRPGRAITNRWGQIQAFYLEKSLLMDWAADGGEGLSTAERALAERAIRESGGKISLEILMGWGWGQGEARRLQEAWKLRGWAENDPARSNALYITPKLTNLLTNLQTLQTPTNRPTNLQTGLQTPYKPTNPQEEGE